MSSNVNAIRAAIEAKLNTDWASATPIAWEAASFNPPEGPYIKPTILWGESLMVRGGAGVAGNRITGVLSISLFDLPGVGKGKLYELADTLRGIFSRAIVGAAQFFAPSGPIEVPGDEDWEHVVVTIPFSAPEA